MASIRFLAAAIFSAMVASIFAGGGKAAGPGAAGGGAGLGGGAGVDVAGVEREARVASTWAFRAAI
jgi:hypothetical protein